MGLQQSGAPTNTLTATVDGQLLKGTSVNDALISFGTKPGAGLGTLSGGAGDDTYTVYSSKIRIIEDAGGGIDTVRSHWTYALPDNVENLTLVGKGPNSAFGNALNNIIIGNTAKNVIEGGAGNDELSGGGNNDSFIVKGHDIIMDWSVGDNINLMNFSAFKSFTQVKSAITQVGADAVLKLGSTDSVTFKNTSAASLTNSAFVLANQVQTYKQTFGDEFDTFKLNLGTGSTDNWHPLYPRSGLSAHTVIGRSVQYFTYPEDTGTYGQPIGVNPFSLKDGVLTITMDRVAPGDESKFYGYSYTSGNITSIGNFHQTYGYFEARLKLAAGQGLHDAFWMLPMDGGWPPELDIVEQRGVDPTRVINGIHSGENTSTGTFLVPTATTEFHTYGLDWQPDYLTWYIDGVPVRTIPTPAGLDKPMYMLLNLGGGSEWAGDPVSTTPFPAKMQIDYVRVYASEHTLEKGVPFDKVGTAGADTMYGTSLGDRLDGALGIDTLYGGAGNDTLIGEGTDRLDGGFGDDTYIVKDPNVVISEGGEKGIDVVQTALASYTLGLNLENLVFTGTGPFDGAGNTEANVITGSSAGGTLSGGAGNDTLNGGASIDTLNGGAGDDVVYGLAGDDIVRGNDGNDRLFGGANNDLIKGDAGDDTVDGGDGDDNLQGNDGDDVLIGAAGNDKLDGGAGADTMRGGTGDDSYVVEDTGDSIVELSGQGVDSVRVQLGTYTLSDNVENLVYTGTSAFSGTGNAVANKINGASGNDTIDGGGGVDILTGGAGGDTFVFVGRQADGDKIVDFAGANDGGADKLLFKGYGTGATIKQVGTTDFFVITADATHGGFVETIQIAGERALAVSDYTFAKDSGTVPNAAPTAINLSKPTVAENAATGSVIGTLSAIDPDVGDKITFQLLDNAGGRFAIQGNAIIATGPLDFETQPSFSLRVQATDSAGNTLVKPFVITVSNVVAGDTLAGTSADDTFVFSRAWAYDRVDGAGGSDTLRADVGSAATLIAGVGSDVAITIAATGAAAGSSLAYPETTIYSANVERLAINGSKIEVGVGLAGTALANGVLVLTGTDGADVLNGSRSDIKLDLAGGVGNDILRGGKSNDVIAGGAGSDKIYGGAGSNQLYGGAGNDTFFLESASDVVVENAGEGADRIVTKFSYTLGANLENLTLSGTFNVNGTGNALDNALVGNAGANILDGAGGKDRLVGGAGNDTFVFRKGEASGDIVVDFAGAGLAGGDVLRLAGFGTGSSLRQVGVSDFYEIHSGTGGAIETLQIAGVHNLTPGDYLFV